MYASRIATDATVRDLNLSLPEAHSAILEHVGSADAVDQGTYHQRALMHIHGNGRTLSLPRTRRRGPWRVPGAAPLCTRGPAPAS